MTKIRKVKLKKKDLKLKIEKIVIKDRKKYKFHLNYKFFVLKSIVALCLVIVAINVMLQTFSNPLSFNFLFGVVCILVAFFYITPILKFNFIIESDKKKIIWNKAASSIDNIDVLEVKRMVLPNKRKIDLCINLITKDKKQIIIPLSIFHNKYLIVAILKKINNNELVYKNV